MYQLKLTKQALLFLFIAICLISCSPAKQEGDKSATAPAKQSIRDAKVNCATSFINAYIANCNKMKEAVDVVKWVNASDQVTPGFKKELQKLNDAAYMDNPELGFEADPLFDAQDYPQKGFELDAYSENSDYILLKGKGQPDFKLTVKVQEVNGKYMIDGCGTVNIPEDKKVGR
jgi:hypothetical protein